MNYNSVVNTSLPLEVDPVLFAFLLKPLFGLLNPLRSSPLAARNWDNDLVDEDEDACSSSSLLSLSLSDVSGTFEPHLKQNLSPEFTLLPHETQNAAIFWQHGMEWRENAGITLADCWRK